jgi:hypothetical protein
MHGGRRTGPVSERRLEIVSTLLLALAAVATAWSSYQAARWQGEQARAFSRANATRLESTRASGLANRQIEIDVATFIQWVDAYAQADALLASFYRKRVRPEFAPALDAWIKTRPLRNPRAPLTPFAMPQYRLAANEEAEKLERTAATYAAEASGNIDRATRYVLCVVLFAASLFFAGISTRLPSSNGRAAALGIGYVVFLGTVAWLATFPVNVDV